MEIIDEFPEKIEEACHYHDSDGKIITMLCSIFGKIYIYHENLLFKSFKTNKALFNVLCLLHQEHNNLELDVLASIIVLPSQFISIVCFDNKSILAFTVNKILKLSSNFFKDLLLKNDVKVLDYVDQVVNKSCSENLELSLSSHVFVIKIVLGTETKQLASLSYQFNEKLYLSFFGRDSFVKKIEKFIVIDKFGSMIALDENNLNSSSFLYCVNCRCISVSLTTDFTSLNVLCENGSMYSFSENYTGEVKPQLFSVKKAWLKEPIVLPINKCLSLISNCCNSLQISETFLLKMESSNKEEASITIEEAENNLSLIHNEIKTVDLALKEKINELNFLQRILTAKTPKVDLTFANMSKVIIEMDNNFFSKQNSDCYVHAISSGATSYSSTSSTNSVDLSYITKSFPKNLTLVCTVQSFTLPLGFFDSKISNLFTISESEAFLNDSFAELKQRVLVLHKSFIEKVKNIRTFLFNDKVITKNKFVICFLGEKVFINIKSIQGHNKLLQLYSCNQMFLDYIMTEIYHKILNAL